MKEPGLFAVVLAAAILCATPLSLNWSSNTMPSLSFDRADAQSKVSGCKQKDRPHRQRAELCRQSLCQLSLRQSVREPR